MSNLKSLKESLDDISSKKNIISNEALFAKAVTDEYLQLRQEEEKARIEKQGELMQEFNNSIALLMRIFKESNFDTVLGMAAQPARLLLLNFFVSVIRGIGFAFGVLVLIAVASQYLPEGFLF